MKLNPLKIERYGDGEPVEKNVVLLSAVSPSFSNLVLSRLTISLFEWFTKVPDLNEVCVIVSKMVGEIEEGWLEWGPDDIL